MLVSVIAPVYRNECSLGELHARVASVSNEFEMVLVDDRSDDGSWAVVQALAARDPRVRGVRLARNLGQDAASLIGLATARGSWRVVLDADLQDPPEIIPAMVDKWREGYQVVFAQRRSRRGERRSKRVVAHIGYWLISRISDVPIPRDTGDCRLIDRKVIDVLRLLPEKHGFLRGLVAFAGYKQTVVTYDREARVSGRSKYDPNFGSIRIGINGVAAFSSKPLTLILIAGCCLTVFALLVAVWFLFDQRSRVPDITPSLATMAIVISLSAGLQLIGLGIVGAYVGRIYDEVLGRPMYIVADRVNFELDEPTKVSADAIKTTTVPGPFEKPSVKACPLTRFWIPKA